MLKLLLFVLFIWVWWHFTLKDSNRDVVAWRGKKYGKTLFRLIENINANRSKRTNIVNDET